MNPQNLLFLLQEAGFVAKSETCRTCKHRLRFALNDHSAKVIQCCELQPSKRSNSGYKTIKVTDKTCRDYEKEKKHESII